VEIYARADPLQMNAACRSLAKLWNDVQRQSSRRRTDHFLTITEDGNKLRTGARTVNR